MNYPQEIQVGANKIKIFLIDGSQTEGDHVADFCRDNNQIRIATRCLDGETRDLVFLNVCLQHEIIEAIKEVFVLQVDEGMIDRLAQGYTQVLNYLGMDLIKEKDAS